MTGIKNIIPALLYPPYFSVGNPAFKGIKPVPFLTGFWSNNPPVLNVDEISFPLGMRPWKINTMLSLDGFRVCITGTGGKGKCLVAQSIMQFSSEDCWKGYMKKLEKFIEKFKKNPDFIYDKEYDKVSVEENQKLYELYIEKLQNTI